MPRVDAIRQVQITEQTFYRWRKQYGGMGTDQLKELKRLQKEDDRLRRAVSDLRVGEAGEHPGADRAVVCSPHHISLGYRPPAPETLTPIEALAPHPVAA